MTQIWRAGDSTYNLQIKEYDIVYIPPTILKQFADLVAGIFVPFASAFSTVFRLLFQIRLYDRFNNTQGGLFF